MSEAIKLTHSQAVNRLKDIDDELERLSAKDALTPEDEVSFAELTREFDETNEYAKKLARTAERARVKSVRDALAVGAVQVERTTDASAGYDRDAILEPDSIEDCRFRNPWDLSEVRTFGRDKGEVDGEMLSRAKAAIDKMPGTKDTVRDAAHRILESTVDKPAALARQILATSSPAYLRAWSKMARNAPHTLSADEMRAMDAVRAMSLTDASGGYLVPFQLDPTVIITSDGSRNDVRKVARQVVATGDVWNGVSSGQVNWSWDAEAAEVSDDATTFAQPTVPVYKAAGFVPISVEALEDEANVTAEVAKLLAFGKDDLEAAAFATGTGSGQPTGIIVALTGGASVVASATTDTFAAADVYALESALPARYRAMASFLANKAIYNRIRQFDTGGGAQLWERIGAGQPAELLGRPALEAEDMDGTITALADNLVLLLGDFSNYVIADRVGMSVEFIPHLFHTSNNRPSGSRGWYAHYRVGADSVNDGAFRLLNVT